MNKNKLKNKVFDEMLIYASEQSALNIIKEIPEEEDLKKVTIPSVEFESKMKKLINTHKRKGQYKNLLVISKRIAVILIVVMMISTITIISVDAFRIKFFNILTEWNEEYIQFKFEDKKNMDLDKNQLPEITLDSNNSIYILTYIPEGYELLYTQEAGELYRAIYVKGDKKITFIQSKIDKTDTAMDTEDADIRKVIILDNEGYFIERDEINSVMWQNNEKVFTIHGNLEQSELIKIAENIKLQEK